MATKAAVQKKAAAPSKPFSYKFGLVQGSHVVGKADEVGNELLRLLERKGVSNPSHPDLKALDPEDVVRAAKPKSSPLHAHIYKHDEKSAAHQHYLLRARQLINSITVTVTVIHKKQTKTVTHRAFERTTAQPSNRGRYRSGVVSRGYEFTPHIVKHSDSRKVLLERARQELLSWQAKWESCEQFVEVFGDVVDAIKKVRIPKRSK